MEVINLQEQKRSSGDIYNSTCSHENIATVNNPIYRWITTIHLSNGFVIKISEDELGQVHKRMS